MTESPEYYPLECALLSQMVYFTGNEPMYFSTIYGNTMFEKEFRNASLGNSYSTLVNDFDKILYVENDLNLLSQRLLDADPARAKLIQFQIEAKKKSIVSHCLKTQNTIIETCFKRRFQDVNTFDDIRDFENTLEDFRRMLILPDNYSFYDDFCKKMKDKIKDNFTEVEEGKYITTDKERESCYAVTTRPRSMPLHHHTCFLRQGSLCRHTCIFQQDETAGCSPCSFHSI